MDAKLVSCGRTGALSSLEARSDQAGQDQAGQDQADLARTRLVEPDGIEPTTSCLQSRRSPS